MIYGVRKGRGGGEGRRRVSHLHGNREVSLSFRWEEDIHSFLGEGLVSCSWGAHFDDMKLKKNEKENMTPISPYAKCTYLCSLLCPDSESEESGLLPIPRHFELGKGGSVALDGLADLSFN